MVSSVGEMQRNVLLHTTRKIGTASCEQFGNVYKNVQFLLLCFALDKYPHVFKESLTRLLLFLFSCKVLYDSFMTSCTVACQYPLSMRFFRQEYWTRLPFPSPGNLPDPGIKPASPVLQADSLPLSHLGSPGSQYSNIYNIEKFENSNGSKVRANKV